MAGDNADKSKKSFWIIIVCAGVVVIGAAIALLQKDKPAPGTESITHTEKIVSPEASLKPQTSEPQSTTPPVSGTTESAAESPEEVDRPVVDYGKLKKDKELQALMEKRKEKYGFEKGVDLIIKPDESIKVGDEVIPMREILEKIRLERGEVIEKDITEPAEPGASASKAEDAGVDALNRAEAMEKMLKASDKPAAETDRDPNKDKKIEQIVSVYKAYKSTEDEIEEKKRILEALRIKNERLRSQAGSPAAPQETGKPKPISEQTQKPETYIPIKPGQQPTPQPAPVKAESIQQPQAQPPADQGQKQRMEEQTKMPKADIPAKSVEQRTVVEKEAPESKSVPPEKPEPKAVRSASEPVPEAKPPQDEGVSVKKPVPSPKELAELESYMKSIQEDINTLMLKKGDLESELKQLLTEREKPEAYGIYVVRHGDNIWDVHFDFLKEYFDSRGIELSRTADEPDAGGRSSGVGKILKFSENMVYIFNMRDRKLEMDINLIHPLSKIVVFNMGQVFKLLDRLAYQDIEKIEFDGNNLWLPAES